LGVRGGFARASGTSTSPIEYGVVMTMVLPLVVTYAMYARSHRWLYRLFLCVVTLAVFLSISRSTLVCASAGVVVLAIAWTPAARLRAALFIAVAGVGVYLTVPGVLGTLTGLFTGASNDPSIASRTGSYDLAWAFFQANPLIGRGFGTFLPKYWILDNGYLGQLIEGGVLGLLGLLSLIVTGVVAARRAQRITQNSFERALAQGVIASIVAGACGLAFFDTFAFPQSAGCFFLLLGLAGAIWRLARGQAHQRDRRLKRPPTPRSPSIGAPEGVPQ
jgi:O-antigen ligase